MKLGRSFRDGLPRDLDPFRDRMRLSAFLPRPLVKPAKLAVGNADVRVVEMPVDVEVSRLAMLFATDEVGEHANGVEVVCSIKRHAFLEGQAAAGFYLFGNAI